MRYVILTSYTSSHVILTPPGGNPVAVPRDFVRGKLIAGKLVLIPGKITEGGIVQP